MHVLRAILCLGFVGWAAYAHACDACGSAVGSGQWGLMPQTRRFALSLRYGQQAFHTRHSMLYAENFSREQIRLTELSLRFALSPRWQLMASLPMLRTAQNYAFAGQETRIWGLGDGAMIANFTAFNTAADTSRTSSYSQQLGFYAGIKTPTGSTWSRQSNSPSLNPNLQTGTGSWDFLFGAMHTQRFNERWGAYAEASARLNTVGRDDFRFGNRFALQARGFYHWRAALDSRWQLLAQAGLSYEANGMDTHRKTIVFGSQTQTLFATAAADVYLGAFVVSAQYQAPIWQTSGDEMRFRRSRWQVQLHYVF